MSSSAGSNITSVLKETRRFAPNAGIRGSSSHQEPPPTTRSFGRRARTIRNRFGAQRADDLHWFRKWDNVLIWNEPHAQWFVGGKINASYNCIDRHLTNGPQEQGRHHFRRRAGRYSRSALPGPAPRGLEVCQRVERSGDQSRRPGDRLHANGPGSLAIAMLACARIGATHSVIFGGFSADAVADRNNDAKARMVITADGGWRRGKIVPLKQNVDAALAKSATVEKCIVFNRCNQPVEMKAGRDLWWHELMANASPDCPAEPLESEHPLYILYTSGSTGKPKGVLHTTAGYLLGTSLTHKWIFDLREDDTYWCTADIGWSHRP